MDRYVTIILDRDGSLVGYAILPPDDQSTITPGASNTHIVRSPGQRAVDLTLPAEADVTHVHEFVTAAIKGGRLVEKAPLSKRRASRRKPRK